MTVEGTAPVPLWLLYEDELDAWRAAQSAHVANWLAEQNFKAEKHRVLLVPDPAGGWPWPSAAWVNARANCRSGTRRGSPSVCRRAAFDWRRTGAQATPRNCAWDLPTERTASSATGR